MHPLLDHPSRRHAFILVWPLAGAVIGVAPYAWAAGPMREAWAPLVWGEALAVPLLASAYVARFAPVGNASTVRVFSTIGASALITTALWLQVGWAWFWSVSGVAPQPFLRFFDMLAPAGTLGTAAFLAMCAIHYTLGAADDRAAATTRAVEAELAARDAELRALRAQVNPHFLFNCLHAIGALVEQDATTARAMCIDLADFFRESLRAGGRARVPMREEIALVGRYLELERRRFGARLIVSIVVAPEAADALVPPLLLQPLAENAVRHGVATLLDGGDITIRIERAGPDVRVTVENAYDPDSRRPGTGIGLHNVRARLDVTYGGRASLAVDPTPTRFRALVTLPAEDLA